jgi:hypothetical protein
MYDARLAKMRRFAGDFAQVGEIDSMQANNPSAGQRVFRQDCCRLPQTAPRPAVIERQLDPPGIAAGIFEERGIETSVVDNNVGHAQYTRRF